MEDGHGHVPEPPEEETGLKGDVRRGHWEGWTRARPPVGEEGRELGHQPRTGKDQGPGGRSGAPAGTSSHSGPPAHGSHALPSSLHLWGDVLAMVWVPCVPKGSQARSLASGVVLLRWRGLQETGPRTGPGATSAVLRSSAVCGPRRAGARGLS